jgi:ABC-type multidrug transport system fused ATPase/permease subunit
MAETPFTLYEYTDQITRQEDGSFRWRCDVEKEYEQRTYKLTLIICAVIAAFILAFGAFLAVMYNDLKSFAIVAGCVVVFMLISLLTCWVLNRLPGTMREIYHMTDEYIETGSGKTRALFSFKRTRKVIVTRKYVELRGRFGGPRVYAPEEDMSFVRGHILSRVPGEAEVRYE